MPDDLLITFNQWINKGEKMVKITFDVDNQHDIFHLHKIFHPRYKFEYRPGAGGRIPRRSPAEVAAERQARGAQQQGMDSRFR